METILYTGFFYQQVSSKRVRTFVIPYGKHRQITDELQWNILGGESGMMGLDSLLQAVSSYTEKDWKPQTLIDPSECMATGSVCAAAYLCVGPSVCAALLCVHVCWLRKLCMSFCFLLKAPSRREGGRIEGTPVSVCLRGEVGRANAVSCSLPDYIHAVLAKFEIFFSSFVEPRLHLQGTVCAELFPKLLPKMEKAEKYQVQGLKVRKENWSLHNNYARLL